MNEVKNAKSSGTLINITEIKAAMPQLEALCNRKIEAGEDFADHVKLIALKSKVDAAVLSSYVTAICKDTLKKTQAKAEQLSLLFETI